MSLNLQNYTTMVPFERTLGEIHSLLLAQGATDFGTLATDCKPTGLRFVFDTGRGPTAYRLDVMVDRVEAKLLADYQARLIERRYATREQAERTAWRNLLALLRVFFTVVAGGQFEADRILMGWMIGKADLTMYEAYAQERPHLTLPGAR